MAVQTPRSVHRESVLRYVIECSKKVMVGKGPTDAEVLWAASRKQKRFSTPTRLDAELQGPPFNCVLAEDLWEFSMDDKSHTINYQARHWAGTAHAVENSSGCSGRHAIVPRVREIEGIALGDTNNQQGASIPKSALPGTCDFSEGASASSIEDFGKPRRHGEARSEWEETSTDDGTSSGQQECSGDSCATASTSSSAAGLRPVRPSLAQARTFVVYHL